jgi:glucose-1-phosphate thymidylyltransferase
VKAILLCAGYATRLRPLTDDVAKPLLPVGGRPMLDWILDGLREVTDDVHVVTNARYAHQFVDWGTGRPVTVHNDHTTTNEDRLGAIGDLRLTIEQGRIDDDLLVVAGDNLFDYSLADYVSWWRGKGRSSAVALYDVGDLRLASRYGVVELDADERFVDFVEKPPEPRSTLATTATYLFHRDHVPLVSEYLESGEPPDPPGRFIAWLYEREPVFGYRFEGEWLDIGDHEQLLEADNRLRRRAGLPERERYTLDTE